VDAASAALPAWSATPARERAEILRRAFDLMTAERDTVARMIVAENGKAWADAVGETAYATEFFRWFSEEASRVAGDFRRSPSGDKTIITDHRPIGVALLITPWNYPAAMATRKIAPALAAGCTVILKPAAETPLTAYLIADILARAGVPDGVVNVVTSSRAGTLVEPMLRDQRVRKLSFTGSTEVGRILLAQAAGGIVSASMELGGNAPFLVLEGADVEAAVSGAMVAKMRNGGAACSAANRFYVHSSLARPFTDRFAAALREVRVGPGTDPANDLGAMVSVRERDKVRDLVGAAVAAGARPVTCGEAPTEGAFIAPVLLEGVEHGAEVTRQEVFGPVAPIITFEHEDEAVAAANDTVHGLIAYVFGRDPARGIAAARRLEAGMVAVDRGMASDPAAPFGGVKQSGLGREGGFLGIHEYLEPQYIAVDL
jgi:succinate-semialdehyde dehydrogenase/glutarate-semialdehyde dehydrogenase